MPVNLTCFCCSHTERHADVEKAFGLGWSRGNHLYGRLTVCPLCSSPQGSTDEHRHSHKRETDSEKTMAVSCGICDKAALGLSLLVRDNPDPRERFGAAVLHINAGVIVRLSPEQLVSTQDALAHGNVFTVLEIANHVMPYCMDCALSYCEDHWHDIHEIFDDGFYDYTLGTCPKGHTHEIDD